VSNLFSSRHIALILLGEGFVFVSQRGSHAKYRKIQDERVLTIIVPMGGQEIPEGTLHSIMKQSQLPKEKFK
jgi:predicted RNA binding protein YcfA (HicA-like mRNA interferase family)